MKDITATDEARRGWMSLMAKAPATRLPALLDAAIRRPDFTWLRPPEVGSVMVRGRAGGTGAPFNLGEMTVTRCALRLHSGEVGHAYIQGRNKADAEAAALMDALMDALMQTDLHDRLQEQVLTPLAAERAETSSAPRAKAAATKVDFFTLVRGED